ncbi:hypothetical protein GRI58_15075 [Porphyrobacter algicida]|uniref:MobA/MobL protein domain-containing protein n=1 Tax=Qipengyuania algicida TaxID=1836209 RepID=A0A845AIP5_9SPHN|nr:MobA/MobL family protein [Qipengyuania algicida]MXP30130.1 hypothetical protein [Qipengyuania algicida]
MKIKTTCPIGHCSARLRQALAIEEEEALCHRVRIRREVKDEKRSRSKRWTATARFDVPAPYRPSRLVSPDGRVSFHFSFETVSKAKGGKSVLTGGSRTTLLSTSAIWDHESYITREGAVPTISAALYEQYVERSRICDESAGVTAAIISNISDDPAERKKFWKAVQECERQAGEDRLAFYPNGLPPTSWLKLAGCDDLTAEARAIAKQLGNAPAKARKKVFLTVSESQAKATIKAARQALGSEFSRKAIMISRARAGRTQYRLNGEFPDAIDAAARLRILVSFCEELKRLRVMYTAVIHEPDEHNDERNHHFHIAIYDRPCAKMIGTDVWDFEYRVKVPGQHNRYNFPARQKKITLFSRGSSGKDFRDQGKSMIFALRSRFADLCNEELQRIGSTRLFDPRTFAEMGIDQTPTRPLGPKAAPLEAAGIPTVTGMTNAEIVWSAEFEQAKTACELNAKRRSKRLHKTEETIVLASETGNAEIARKLEQLVDRARTKSEFLDRHELSLEEYRVTLEMAWSRSDKTEETCDRIIKSLERGGGTKADRRDESLIRRRWDEASEFADFIHQIHLENSATVESIAGQVLSARSELVSIYNDIAQTRIELDAELANPVANRMAAEASIPHHNAGEIEPREERFRQLFEKILNELTVMAPSDANGVYTVPGISRQDLKLITDDRNKARAQARLASIAKLQAKRVRQALELQAKHGHDGLAALAGTHHTVDRALHHLEVYKRHPLVVATAQIDKACDVADAVCNDEPTMAISVKPVVVGSDHQTDTPGEESQPAKLQTVERNWVIPDQSEDRQKGIVEFADFIRTDSGVKIAKIDGRLEVDFSAADGGERISKIWADEPEVLQAIQDRYYAEEARRCPESEIVYPEAVLEFDYSYENDLSCERITIAQVMDLHPCYDASYQNAANSASNSEKQDDIASQMDRESAPNSDQPECGPMAVEPDRVPVVGTAQRVSEEELWYYNNGGGVGR